MNPDEDKIFPTDSFWPLPWDEDPNIEWFLCLEAVYHGDTKLPAKYLRETAAPDRRVLDALAEKLHPTHQSRSKYVLKRSGGRPQKCISSDPLVVALHNGDLQWIANHLRGTSPAGHRVVQWIADHLDPPMPDRPRLVVVQGKGAPSKYGEWATFLGVPETERAILGLKIARKARELGSLEAAFRFFRRRNNEWHDLVSRPTARRAYDLLLRKKRAAKNLPDLVD